MSEITESPGNDAEIVKSNSKVNWQTIVAILSLIATMVLAVCECNEKKITRATEQMNAVTNVLPYLTDSSERKQAMGLITLVNFNQDSLAVKFMKSNLFSDYPLRVAGLYIMKTSTDINIRKDVKGYVTDCVWALSNLTTDTFTNGDTIFYAENKRQWDSVNAEKAGAWCYYDTLSENGRKYGKLYNCYAVLDDRGLAPKGWHVASLDEFKMLIYESLFTPEDMMGSPLLSNDSLKIIDSSVNRNGFQGLLGGYCDSNFLFKERAQCGTWWTTSNHNLIDKTKFYYFTLRPYTREWNPVSQNCGFYVRCIKDTI